MQPKLKSKVDTPTLDHTMALCAAIAKKRPHSVIPEHLSFYTYNLPFWLPKLIERGEFFENYTR